MAGFFDRGQTFFLIGNRLGGIVIRSLRIGQVFGRIIQGPGRFGKRLGFAIGVRTFRQVGSFFGQFGLLSSQCFWFRAFGRGLIHGPFGGFFGLFGQFRLILGEFVKPVLVLGFPGGGFILSDLIQGFVNFFARFGQGFLSFFLKGSGALRIVV